jgi:hypothetical protein
VYACILRVWAQINSVLKKEIITALTARWVASDGLEVHQVHHSAHAVCRWERESEQREIGTWERKNGASHPHAAGHRGARSREQLDLDSKRQPAVEAPSFTLCFYFRSNTPFLYLPTETSRSNHLPTLAFLCFSVIKYARSFLDVRACTEIESARGHVQWSKRDMLNLPPDRTMYGRAFWTFMHTVSVYLPHTPSPDQLAAFKGDPCLALCRASRPIFVSLRCASWLSLSSSLLMLPSTAP